MMGAVPDLNPANKISWYAVFPEKGNAFAMAKQEQFYSIGGIQKDLGRGHIGLFQRIFLHFLLCFLPGLNLSVGSAPGSVIS